MLTMASTQSKNGQSGNQNGFTSLEELETKIPCRFPTLVETSTTKENHFLSSEIDISKIDETIEFCTAHNISVVSLLRAAWAIVLRGYASTTEILFTSQSCDNIAEDTLIGAQLNPNQSLFDIIQHIHSSRNSFIPLSKEQRRYLLQPSPHGICNSEIRYISGRHDEQNDIAILENTLVSKYPYFK